MKRLISIFNGLVIIGLLAFLSGCEYDYPVPEPLPDVVSFSNNILPFFSSSCAFAGCHNTGGESPDLTAENAYSALMSTNQINLENPEESLLYTKIASGGTMAPYSTPANTALVLAWIKDGAQNN